MARYDVANFSELDGVVKKVRKALGVTAFGVNVLVLAPGVVGRAHYHEEQDEWFYCLVGEYVVEIGDQRLRLGPGDSVLGPRRRSARVCL